LSSEASEKSHGGEQLLHRGAGTGARIADVEALALEILELGDARLLAHQHGEWFGMQREHGAQIAEGVALVLAVALEGVELDIGLRHAEIEFAGLDRIDVERRTSSRFDRAADSVRAAVLVEQTADCPARGVVDAGDAAGPDGDEALALRRRRLSAQQRGRQRHRCHAQWGSLHGLSPGLLRNAPPAGPGRRAVKHHHTKLLIPSSSRSSHAPAPPPTRPRSRASSKKGDLDSDGDAAVGSATKVFAK
jgi:hypothetical protein